MGREWSFFIEWQIQGFIGVLLERVSHLKLGVVRLLILSLGYKANKIVIAHWSKLILNQFLVFLFRDILIKGLYRLVHFFLIEALNIS